MNFNDLFDLSMYELEEDEKRFENDLLIETYAITVENTKISQTESMHISFNYSEEGISIRYMETWLKTKEGSSPTACPFCGCTERSIWEKEDIFEDEPDATFYTHKCAFNEEDVKDYLLKVREVEHQKMISDITESSDAHCSFSITKEERRVYISLKVAVLNPLSMEHEYKYYDKLVVMEAIDDDDVTTHLNEIMIKQITKAGYMTDIDFEKFNQTIDQAETIFNCFVH